MKSLKLALITLLMTTVAYAAKPGNNDILRWVCGPLMTPNGIQSKSAPYLTIISHDLKGDVNDYVKATNFGGRESYQVLKTIATSSKMIVQQSKDYEVVTKLSQTIEVKIKSRTNSRFSAVCRPADEPISTPPPARMTR